MREPEQLIIEIPALPPAATALRMACYQWGDPEAKRTVLCVHGLTRNGRDFDFLAQDLAQQGFRVLCPDMPGRGKSDYLPSPAEYNYPAYVGHIAHLLLTLGLTSVDWVGTSMGGIIGMMMANAQPGLLRSLVLNDVGCVVSGVGIKRIMSYPPSSACPSLDEAQQTMRERCAPFGIRDEAHWQHMFTYGITDRNGCFVPTYDPAIMAAYTQERDAPEVADIVLWPLWEAVAPVPVLLIRGAESDLLTHQTAVEMQSRHPRLTLHEIPATGHAPALMDPEQRALICSWLRD